MSPKWLEEIKFFMKNLIGNTADTGGSATAGTLAAKVNAILSGQAKQETVQSILSKLNTSGAITVNAVKSVQRGTITIAKGTTEKTASINEVDINKAFVLFGGLTTPISESYYRPNEVETRLELKDSKTVAATRQISNSSYGITVAYQVIEFY